MTLPVHWVESLAGVRRGDRVEVAGDEAHHAVTVRRMRIGEGVVLTDGRGHRATGTVADAAKRRLVVTVSQAESLPEPAPAFTVVQALPKGDRGELAVELLTEVGVARIVPWAASRCVAVWRGDRSARALARWRATAREASKQARRAWFAEVAELASTDDAAGWVSGADLAVVLHESAEGSLSDLPVPPSGSVTIVVGPEGGLTDEEVAAFTVAGAHAVRLGREVLRTSTAGVAAVSALMSRSARWA
jgi:16S rRNA (uracil1498-N3)-methyltransferase